MQIRYPIFFLYILFQGIALKVALADKTIDNGVAAFKATIGLGEWQKLEVRLAALNQDVAKNGVHSFPGTSELLFTFKPSLAPYTIRDSGPLG